MSSIFDRPEYKAYRAKWDARQKELISRGGYYDGSIYKRTKDTFWFLGGQVGGNIKPLFLPFSRAVDVDAGLIPSGWDFPKDEPRAENWKAARNLLFDRSKWDTNGVLFVHFGAVYGVSGIRVSNEPDIRITPANPTKYMLVYDDIYSDVPTKCFWVETYKDGDKSYEYAEVITAETITTYKDGEPYGYSNREPETKNTIGKIPVFECVHINDDTENGECTYQKAIVLLDEVNDMATRLLTIVKKHEKPQTIIAGAEPTELERGDDTAWFLPSGADAKFAIPNIDIQGVLEFIREIKAGVHDALPELSFDEIKKSSQIATATIELQLMELVIKIKRTRPNYDRALTEAMQLAGSISSDLVKVLDDENLILDEDRTILPVMARDAIDLEIAQIELDNMRRAVPNA